MLKQRWLKSLQSSLLKVLYLKLAEWGTRAVYWPCLFYWVAFFEPWPYKMFFCVKFPPLVNFTNILWAPLLKIFFQQIIKNPNSKMLLKDLRKFHLFSEDEESKFCSTNGLGLSWFGLSTSILTVDSGKASSSIT